ncbi:Na+/H+ antiporter subunit G [Sphingomonas jatrophae]|uniref:Multisubunit potassium/proton antiporter, PhaG subunit n=1 Tax=Sphingomonas jatrophae TaxID=1166337 RepID=A0A1I6M154_9SPHN|nr:Na+/H+ antiporter subunit G [Sphingomonas jatrophae]SFS09358.1 multisubunit potassium/proton antiporter, PhaG subunit [Sphingomonas jatrophae]
MLADLLIAALLLLGGGFVLIGSWGLVRLRSTMERLHGPTKATTLGLGALLVASVVFFQAKLGTWTAHELLISLFLFITAPISANMIAKVHMHRLRTGAVSEPASIAGPPPRPANGSDWATFEAPHSGTPTSTANS